MQPRPKKLHLLRWMPSWLIMTRGPSANGEVYLTFDDGPHPDFTPAVLDLLARHDAKASFFLIGSEVDKHPELAQRMTREGHMIGNHSFSHPEFRRMGLADQVDQLARGDAALQRIDGRRHHPVRTPRGALPWRLVQHLAFRRRAVIQWSYDSLDYQRGDATAVIDMMRREPPRPGDIVLMHDDGPAVLHVLETLLPEWRGAGLRLAALPQRAGEAA